MESQLNKVSYLNPFPHNRIVISQKGYPAHSNLEWLSRFQMKYSVLEEIGFSCREYGMKLIQTFSPKYHGFFISQVMWSTLMDKGCYTLYFLRFTIICLYILHCATSVINWNRYKIWPFWIDQRDRDSSFCAATIVAV